MDKIKIMLITILWTTVIVGIGFFVGRYWTDNSSVKVLYDCKDYSCFQFPIFCIENKCFFNEAGYPGQNLHTKMLQQVFCEELPKIN